MFLCCFTRDKNCHGLFVNLRQHNIDCQSMIEIQSHSVEWRRRCNEHRGSPLAWQQSKTLQGILRRHCEITISKLFLAKCPKTSSSPPRPWLQVYRVCTPCFLLTSLTSLGGCFCSSAGVVGARVSDASIAGKAVGYKGFALERVGD